MRCKRTQTSEIPETVVHGGHRSSVLGVDDLGEQHGGSQLRQRITETQDETTSAKHCGYVRYAANGSAEKSRGLRTPVTVGESSQETTENHENTASNDGRLTSPPIGDRRAGAYVSERGPMTFSPG